MVGIIDAFRACVLGSDNSRYGIALTIAVVDVIILLVSGVWYFRKTEQTFADVI